MKQCYVVWFTVLALALTAVAADCATLSKAQERDWIRYTIPLAKSITIPESVTVTVGTVAIIPPAQSDQVVNQTVKELQELFGTATAGDAAFTVKLAIGGDDSKPLESLKNPDQAYRIFPEGKNTLKLVALTSRGLYYAAGTLQQLAKAKLDAGKVEMPLVTVLDWPDLEDRGLWGCDSDLHLKWMGSIKFNIDEQISARSVDAQGRGHATPKDPQNRLCLEGPLYGIKPVPVALHLDQVMGAGMLEAYPKFKGIGGERGAICYSQPEFVNVLRDWIVDLGSLPNVSEVDVWMSENLHAKGGCKCANCIKTERSLLESRIIVKAWRAAQETLPNLGLRVLSSEETARMNGRIIEDLPKEVKFWYYHSQLTYNTDRSDMITQELEKFARAGRWIGVCPSLTQYCQPFTCPQFAKFRMNEFIDKELRGLIAYDTPRTEFGHFNVEGAAEWSWNPKGRSTTEFAISYAVRNGIKNPELFAKWAELQGDLEWDVYGSDWPNGDKKSQPGKVATLLLEGRMPDLGVATWTVYGTPFAGIKNAKRLDADVAAAVRTVALAKQLGVPKYILESTIVQAYINSQKALYELRCLAPGGEIKPQNRYKARRQFKAYIASLQTAIDTLQPWEAAVTGDKDSNITLGEREQLKGMQNGMKDTALKLGVRL